MSAPPAATRRAALAGLCASALAAPAYARDRHDAQVIVLGAGIAGLETALRLEAAGLDVQVVEATSRIGGRLQTWTDLPGSPNAGGVQIGASYGRLRARAAALGVPLDPEPSAPRASRIAIGNTLIDPREWAASPLNPFPEAHKGVQPGAALFALGGRANPLAAFDDWRGAKGVAADVSADAFLAGQGFSPQARALVDVGLNANSLDTYSMVNVWRSMTLFAADRAMGTGSSVVRGGSQALPEAMARALKRPVMLDLAAQEIRVSRSGAQVRVQGFGGARGRINRTMRAGHVVAALPFPVLGKMRLDAPLSVETREAIAGLPYTQIIQMVVEPATRFIEVDGLPIDMWTDGPLERMFSIRDANGSDTGQIMMWLNGTGATAMDGPLVALRMRQLSASIASSATAPNASPQVRQLFASMAAKPIEGDPRLLASEILKGLRPASEGRLRFVRAMQWTASNAYAGGAYMHWAPGQIARWAGRMGAPAGRLVFAGEHLGLVHTGMEAAFESAEAAAAAILAELKA